PAACRPSRHAALPSKGGGGRGGPVGALLGQSEILTRGMNELASGVPPLMLDPHGTVIVVALIALVTLLLDVMFLDLGWHTPTGLDRKSTRLNSSHVST